MHYAFMALAAICVAEPALSQVWTDDREALEDVANTVCDAYAMAAGEKAATAIATIAIFGLGVAAIAGMVSKAQAVTIAGAIAGVFGSFAIASVITGRDRECDDLLGSYTSPPSAPVTNSQSNPNNQSAGGGPPTPCNEIDLGNLWLSSAQETVNFTVAEDDNYTLELSYLMYSLSTSVEFELAYSGNTATSLFSGSGSRTITFPDGLLAVGSSYLLLEKNPLAEPVQFYSMRLRGSGC